MSTRDGLSSSPRVHKPATSDERVNDVSGALTPASKPPRLPNGSSFASRDLFFAPPIELSKPGCFVEMHLEVPRVTDYDDAEPPKFFVSRVFLAPEPTPEPALDDVADDDEELEVPERHRELGELEPQDALVAALPVEARDARPARHRRNRAGEKDLLEREVPRARGAPATARRRGR